MMVYIDINGVHLDQLVLVAIVEGLLSYGVLLAILITVHCPCMRPRAPRLRWLRGWRAHATIYALMAMLAEGSWVQLGLVIDTDRNGMGCAWTQARLGGWTTVQLGCLMCMLGVWTYCRRRPVAPMINGVVAVHSSSMMAFAMLGMFEDEACGAIIFPLLAASVGMLNTCCCVPWYSGAWSTYLSSPTFKPKGPGLRIGGITDPELGTSALLIASDEFQDVSLITSNQEAQEVGKRLAAQQRERERSLQRNLLTCWGFMWRNRQRKRHKRTQERWQAANQGQAPILAEPMTADPVGNGQGASGGGGGGTNTSNSSPLTSDSEADEDSITAAAGTGLAVRRRNPAGDANGGALMEEVEVVWAPDQDPKNNTELQLLSPPPEQVKGH